MPATTGKRPAPSSEAELRAALQEVCILILLFSYFFPFLFFGFWVSRPRCTAFCLAHQVRGVQGRASHDIARLQRPSIQRTSSGSWLHLNTNDLFPAYRAGPPSGVGPRRYFGPSTPPWPVCCASVRIRQYHLHRFTNLVLAADWRVHRRGHRWLGTRSRS